MVPAKMIMISIKDFFRKKLAKLMFNLPFI